MTVGELIRELSYFPTEAEIKIGEETNYAPDGTLSGVWNGLQSKYTEVIINVVELKNEEETGL